MQNAVQINTELNTEANTEIKTNTSSTFSEEEKKELEQLKQKAFQDRLKFLQLNEDATSDLRSLKPVLDKRTESLRGEVEVFLANLKTA